MSVAERVVVITGAGSGIGEALAVGFASDGASVVGFGRREASLAAAAEKCPGGMVGVAGDVTSEEDVDRLVATTMDRFGRIDVLINNAGIHGGGKLIDKKFEDWARVIEVNLTGLALCTHRLLPVMMEGGYGRIVNSFTSCRIDSTQDDSICIVEGGRYHFYQDDRSRNRP